MAEPEPLILYNPDLTINDVTLKCLMSHIEMTPDVTTVEVKTSCGTKEYPGSVKWTLKASLYHSFDPAGTNEVLTAAVEGHAPVPFSVLPKSNQPISATNPEFYGELIPQPFRIFLGTAIRRNAKALVRHLKEDVVRIREALHRDGPDQGIFLHCGCVSHGLLCSLKR